MHRILLTALCLALTSQLTRAELVYFSAGGQAQVPAVIEGDIVTLSTPFGALKFQGDDFRKIVPGHNPEAEWPRRRSDAVRASSAERFSAAWWALENGLTPQAEEFIRTIAAADPSFEPVRRLLPPLDRLAHPLPEPDLAPFAGILPLSGHIARSDHIILFHQHTVAEAQSRIDVLERVFRSFYVAFAAQGIELSLPPRKLISVWFAEKGDYLAYLKRDGAGNFLTTRGYYHPTKGFVLAYDARSDASKRRTAANLESRRREWNGLERALTALPTGQEFTLSPRGEPSQRVPRDRGLAIVAARQRDLARQALLMDLDNRSLDLGTAAHELIHQLVAESGLAPRHADFPFWLHEGLAMQFEVIRGGRWAGISRVNELRLSDFRKITPAPHLAPLIRDRGFGQGYRSDLYGEAWSFVYFLRKEHPDTFIAWLAQLRQAPHSGPSSSGRSTQLFDATFRVELPTLESSWHAYMERLKTPFEDGEASPPDSEAPQSD